MAPAAPILLAPLLKHRAWGGDFLLRIGRRPAPREQPPFGESWEVADLEECAPDGRSQVVGGAFDGLTLHEAIRREPVHIMGDGWRPGQSFPLLVKYLDAREEISVQVHPTPAYATRHPDARVKNEAWFVIDAKPGAVVHRGVDPNLSRHDLEALLDTGRLLDAMIRVPVRAGDFIQLPSGLCHALGAGVTVAEVQTASDTTFRLWDWNRNDARRPLHRRQALECVLLGAAQRLESIPVISASTSPSCEAAGLRTTRLCRNDEFEIEWISTVERAGGEAVQLEIVTDGAPVIWTLFQGSLRVESAGHSFEPVSIGAWTTVLFPAASHGAIARIAPGSAWLRTTLPDPLRHMLAQRERPR